MSGVRAPVLPAATHESGLPVEVAAAGDHLSGFVQVLLDSSPQAGATKADPRRPMKEESATDDLKAGETAMFRRGMRSPPSLAPVSADITDGHNIAVAVSAEETAAALLGLHLTPAAGAMRPSLTTHSHPHYPSTYRDGGSQLWFHDDDDDEDRDEGDEHGRRTTSDGTNSTGSSRNRHCAEEFEKPASVDGVESLLLMGDPSRAVTDSVLMSSTKSRRERTNVSTMSQPRRRSANSETVFLDDLDPEVYGGSSNPFPLDLVDSTIEHRSSLAEESAAVGRESSSMHSGFLSKSRSVDYAFHPGPMTVSDFAAFHSPPVSSHLLDPPHLPHPHSYTAVHSAVASHHHHHHHSSGAAASSASAAATKLHMTEPLDVTRLDSKAASLIDLDHLDQYYVEALPSSLPPSVTDGGFPMPPDDSDAAAAAIVSPPPTTTTTTLTETAMDVEHPTVPSSKSLPTLHHEFAGVPLADFLPAAAPVPSMMRTSSNGGDAPPTIPLVSSAALPHSRIAHHPSGLPHSLSHHSGTPMYVPVMVDPHQPPHLIPVLPRSATFSEESSSATHRHHHHYHYNPAHGALAPDTGPLPPPPMYHRHSPLERGSHSLSALHSGSGIGRYPPSMMHSDHPSFAESVPGAAHKMRIPGVLTDDDLRKYDQRTAQAQRMFNAYKGGRFHTTSIEKESPSRLSKRAIMSRMTQGDIVHVDTRLLRQAKFTLPDLVEKQEPFLKLCKNKFGSKFIQRLAECPTTPLSHVHELIEAVIPFAKELCLDIFGNYIIQKILEVTVERVTKYKNAISHLTGADSSSSTKTGIVVSRSSSAAAAAAAVSVSGGSSSSSAATAAAVTSSTMRAEQIVMDQLDGWGHALMFAIVEHNTVELASNQYGCRVLQRILKYEGSIGGVKSCVLNEVMKNEMMLGELIMDEFGNHVIQKCIENMEAYEMDDLAENVSINCVLYSSNIYGCRVVQRILTNCSRKQTFPIFTQVLKNLSVLCMDEYGNYVVQHSVNCSQDSHWLEQVTGFLSDHCATLVRQRFSANVVEKSLRMLPLKQKRSLLCALLASEVDTEIARRFAHDGSGIGLQSGTKVSLVGSMVLSDYANYVVQTMLDVCEVEHFTRICMLIQRDVSKGTLLTLQWGRFINQKMLNPKFHLGGGSAAPSSSAVTSSSSAHVGSPVSMLDPLMSSISPPRHG